MNCSEACNKFLWMWGLLEAQASKPWWNPSSLWLSHIKLIPEINPANWQVNLSLLPQKSSTALSLTVFFLLGLSPFLRGSLFTEPLRKFMDDDNVTQKIIHFKKAWIQGSYVKQNMFNSFNVDSFFLLWGTLSSSFDTCVFLILFTWALFHLGFGNVWNELDKIYH